LPTVKVFSGGILKITFICAKANKRVKMKKFPFQGAITLGASIKAVAKIKRISMEPKVQFFFSALSAGDKNLNGCAT